MLKTVRLRFNFLAHIFSIGVSKLFVQQELISKNTSNGVDLEDLVEIPDIYTDDESSISMHYPALSLGKPMV